MVRIANRFVSTFLLLGQLALQHACCWTLPQCDLLLSSLGHLASTGEAPVAIHAAADSLPIMISSRLIHIPALWVCFLQFSCIHGLEPDEALRALGVPPLSLWTGSAPPEDLVAQWLNVQPAAGLKE